MRGTSQNSNRKQMRGTEGVIIKKIVEAPVLNNCGFETILENFDM